jgi:tetratricopeptide (TPR) repeat protein
MNTIVSGDSLNERFEEALELARSGQTARATNLFAECVVGEPGNPAFVQAFLEHLSQQQSGGQNGQADQAALPPALQQALAENDWPQIQRLGPRHLVSHPADVVTLLALSKAGGAQGHAAAELCFLQHANQIAPDSAEIHRLLGRALTRQRRFDEALAHWRRVEELDEADAEAPAVIAALTTQRSRERSGLATAERDQWLLASGANGLTGNHRSAGIKLRTSLDKLLAAGSSPNPTSPNLKRTPIQELEVAIREFPSNAEYYLQIVPLYLQANRDYDAEKLLAKGRSATSNDARVCELWEDVTMLRMERKLALAQKHAQELDTLEARNDLTQTLAERDQLETDIFVSRCKREPDNAAVRIELAKRLRRAGKVREACQKLEEGLRDPLQRCFAALELGECQLQLGNSPEALRYFRMAADAAHRPEHLAARKQALYHAGRLATRLKMNQLAERYLAELLRLDVNYKDAPAMLAGAQRQAAAL